MADYFLPEEMENEITRPEIVKNMPHYRQKGRRFTENMAGWCYDSQARHAIILDELHAGCTAFG